MKKLIWLIASIGVCVWLDAFAQNNPKQSFSKADSLLVFNPKISEKIKLSMFKNAAANLSTEPNYVVIVCTDQLTGKTKELCTEAPFLIGGLERNKNNTSINSTSMHYYFDTKAALKNIGFNDYNYFDLLRYGQKAKVRSIIATLLKSKNKLSYIFTGTSIEQTMFAHILFNNGIMATRGCVAGNMMELTKTDAH